MSERAKRVALYARVSTDNQTTENQLFQLRAVAERHGWEVVAEYVDHAASGAMGRESRVRLDAMMKGLTRREFDMVAAWSVDRLGRSLQHLVGFLEDLKAKKVDLYLHQQALDTSTPMGRAMFQMCGVFAELERSIIRERVNAGLERARAKGKVLGRPRVAKELEGQIHALLAKGVGKVKIGKTIGVATSVVQRLAKQPLA